ncbi:SRPBCC family protein [Chitiniphilus eburneus]|uniref:Vanillate O-demethylase oxidoreductase VanB n=1 Tax=Chitiniphilus eburneus TaxID=2571148 RepID=A0A4U0PX41_9NEIS|nr:SRPBCC family protein [Chitiniphilus eburneus]TJZ73146.1 vanillate O-demethylase oxidoreductase VanB [Chitiniphilus eburneus]
MNTATDTDRIERSIVINAPRERVWRALSQAETFGTWFGADLKGQAFEPGQRTRGRITISGFEHVFFDVVIERVEPQHLLSYHWHPFAIDPNVDYELEPPTRVVFTLQDVPGEATLLKVVESGFDNVPPHRRMEAFRMNGQGWSAQMDNLSRYVSTQQ